MNTKGHVVYLGPAEGCEAASAVLSGLVEVRRVEPATGEMLLQNLGQCVGLLDASMRVALDARVFDAATALRVVSCATTGSSHIDLDAATAKGVPVHTLREDGPLLRDITPAAELSWALLMSCARNVTGAARHVRDGRWDRELFPGRMLKGKQLGLIGCGRIGGWMAQYARAFGMEVVGSDPFVATMPEGVRAAPLDEIFATSDFVSLHLHLSPETRGIVTRALLESAKPGLILINTSRGGLVDEAALVAGLNSGRIGAAGLDVIDGEPDIAQHPLVQYARQHDNLVITPHCGGYSPDAVRIVCRRAAEKIANYLNG